MLLFSIKIPNMNPLLSTTTTSALIGAAVAVANYINDMKNVDQELKKLKGGAHDIIDPSQRITAHA